MRRKALSSTPKLPCFFPVLSLRVPQKLRKMGRNRQIEKVFAVKFADSSEFSVVRVGQKSTIEAQIPVGNGVANEGREDGHAAEEDSEWNFVVAQHESGGGPGSGPDLGSLVTASAGDAFAPDGEGSDQAEDAPQQRAGKDGKQSQFGSEKCSDHGHELYVAESHTFNVAQAEVDLADCIYKESAEGGSDERFDERNCSERPVEREQPTGERVRESPHRNKDAEDQTCDEAGKREDVGKKVMLEVDEDQAEQ